MNHDLAALITNNLRLHEDITEREVAEQVVAVVDSYLEACNTRMKAYDELLAQIYGSISVLETRNDSKTLRSCKAKLEGLLYPGHLTKKTSDAVDEVIEVSNQLYKGPTRNSEEHYAETAAAFGW